MNLTATKTYHIDKSQMMQSVIDFMYGAVSGVALAVYFFIGI